MIPKFKRAPVDGYCDACEVKDEAIWSIPNEIKHDYGCHMELCEYCIEMYEREEDK